MKVCSTCGDTYQDYVDFCFNDGEVLLEADVGGVAPSLLPGMGATPGPRRANAPSAASMMATPVPRERAGRQSPPAAQPSSNVPSAASATPVPLQDTDDEDDDLDVEPSAASLAMTQPIEIGPGHERMPVAPVSADETAPIPRPQRHDLASQTTTPSAQPRAAVPVAAANGAGKGPLVRATTFESEVEEPESSRILLFGVAAALFGAFLLISGGVVFVGATTGLFGPTATTDGVAVVDPLPVPDPVPVEVPQPLPEPDPVAPEPEPAQPVEAVAEPVPAPEPVAPAPTEVEPAPQAPVAPVPGPRHPPRPVPVVTPGPVPAHPKSGKAPEVVEAAPVKQSVALKTDPPGAAIYLGGSLVLPATPGSIDLEPGAYTLEARLQGHKGSTAEVTVGEGPVAAHFPPLEALPVVRVTVMWAPGKDYPTEVTVDGQKIGCPIPCTSPMTAGPHVLEVFSANGTSFQKSVTIREQPTDLVNLEPPP